MNSVIYPWCYASNRLINYIVVFFFKRDSEASISCITLQPLRGSSIMHTLPCESSWTNRNSSDRCHHITSKHIEAWLCVCVLCVGVRPSVNTLWNHCFQFRCGFNSIYRNTLQWIWINKGLFVKIIFENSVCWCWPFCSWVPFTKID